MSVAIGWLALAGIVSFLFGLIWALSEAPWPASVLVILGIASLVAYFSLSMTLEHRSEEEKERHTA